MILTGLEIKKEISSKKIIISDFNSQRISTNSYDLLLDNTLIKYTDEILDCKKPSKYTSFRIPNTGYKLNSGDFVLGASKERVGSNYYVPMIHAKSGIARKGLFVHCSTGLIDVGSHGQITFQIFATLPIIIYPFMPIAQVTFWQTKGEITLYKGKYSNNSKGPQASKIFNDFK